jgi:Fe-S cluster assembly protein SufD
MNAMASDHSLFFVDQFSRQRDSLPGQQWPWLRHLREQALAAFLAGGFPSRRQEEWKYTSVAAIAQSRFALAEPIDAALERRIAGEMAALALPGTRRLVFIDGHYAPSCSDLGPLPAGVTIASLAACLAQPSVQLHAWLEPQAPYASAFAALNTACLADGAYIELAAGAVLAEPLHLLFIAASDERATHSRTLLRAAEGSRICLIEQHVALGARRYLSNVASNLLLGPGAQVEHHKLQSESLDAFHIAATQAELAADSQLLSTAFAFGSALARTDLNVDLNGIGARCSLDGLYLADGQQHLDQRTRIDHRRPRGSSRELYKGVLAGAGRAVFNGKVIVQPAAQQSDAAQSNRNLLLSVEAEIDSKPQLEIWADDVKCSHGATVGQLDDEQIFYLRSRGIDAAAARALLTYAFAAEVVARLGQAPLRARLDALLRARLALPLESPS